MARLGLSCTRLHGHTACHQMNISLRVPNYKGILPSHRGASLSSISASGAGQRCRLGSSDVHTQFYMLLVGCLSSLYMCCVRYQASGQRCTTHPQLTRTQVHWSHHDWPPTYPHVQVHYQRHLWPVSGDSTVASLPPSCASEHGQPRGQVALGTLSDRIGCASTLALFGISVPAMLSRSRRQWSRTAHMMQ